MMRHQKCHRDLKEIEVCLFCLLIFTFRIEVVSDIVAIGYLGYLL
jgi:hypothetical protein